MFSTGGKQLACHLLEQEKQSKYTKYISTLSPLPPYLPIFYCSSYLSPCQRSHTGDVSSIRRLGSSYKYIPGNFRLSRALDKQLPMLLIKCIVYMGKKPAPLRTQQCYPAFLQELQCYLLTVEALSSSNHLLAILHFPTSWGRNLDSLPVPQVPQISLCNWTFLWWLRVFLLAPHGLCAAFTVFAH